MLQDRPQPASVGEPHIYSGNGPLLIFYATSDERVAAVEFAVCNQLLYGYPNDEALGAHPLYAKGLKYYSVHRVEGSSRLCELERANAVHPRHDRDAFLREKEHYVFTFQDATLECLVTTGARFPPRFRVFSSAAEANAAFGRNVA